VLTLAQTEFVKGFSRLGLVGTLDLNGGPRFQGKATITQSEIAELLATLQLFRLNDLGRGLAAPQYARAAAVQTIPVGLPQQSLQRQFQRLSEIKVLLAQVAESRQQLIIPESLDVRGLLNGNITLDASLTQGVKADFDLQATDVAWRPYPTYSTLGSEDRPPDRVLKAETVTARGTFDNGEVNLAPVLFNLGDAQLKVSGKFGGAAPEGQVTATNLPLETIKIFYPAFNSVPSIPILDGRVNATATVNGTRENPQATGLLDLVNARLNGTPIDKGQITFGYNQARLKFGGAATVNSPEPLTVEGDIPLPLPFVAVQPTNLDVALAVNVKNQGLALLNLVIPADSVRWIDGQGELALRVSGTLLKPVIAGNLTLNNAQIKAQALPEIITGVTGTVKLEGDRIRVEQLQGQFSRGQIAVRGVLPILQPLINPESAVVEGAIEGPPAGTQAVNSLEDAARPLTVDLKQIALRLKGLYRGNVNGQLLVRGTALAPKLGGEIRLTDGQVLLPEETTDTAASGGAAGGAAGGNPITALTLDGLQLKLGDRIQVIKPPIVNFVARGNLTVNGPLSNLQPEGVINLEAGQVNIFTTQFTLARGHKQTARFIAGQGLDPELNVRLIASVPEVTRSRLPSTTLSSEVNDAPLLATNLGSLQTVRIQARVVGPASALFEKLELTSSPGRERAEIISLLGGGFINTNGRGDTTLGIANLAGSALLTNVQGLIGQALGLSEFRLFPTRTTNPRGQSSTLGLAAEAGVDITPGISASVLRVLTSSQSTQFGLRYRINDRLLFRGSTDFSGDNRAVLEYEARF
jgi:translocation and assembly module TamB